MKEKRLTIGLSSLLILLETEGVDMYVNIYKHQLEVKRYSMERTKKFTLTMQ
jgi:hypothetical protein